MTKFYNKLITNFYLSCPSLQKKVIFKVNLSQNNIKCKRSSKTRKHKTNS